MSSFETLKRQIQEKEIQVGVIGLGYVGLPLSDALHRGGLNVAGFDVDQRKVTALDEGQTYLKHFPVERCKELSESDRFSATTDFSRLGAMDVVIVCVPTPVGVHMEPDLSYVTDSAASIGKTLRSGQLIILESTTYPGTTRGEFLEAMLDGCPEDVELTLGEDFFVAYSPEREDPGNQNHSTSSIPKLVGGLDPRATELAAMTYRYGVDEIVEVSSAEIAESAKLLENIFRSVNIALVNEIKMILTEMGIDVWEVIEAASTKPFGFMPFYPGPGLGGHCIPIDPFYLSWKAREVDKPTRFIELAGEINTSMPKYIVNKTMLALNEEGKALRGARILILGLAYKKDVDDTRESPSFELIEGLRELGADVQYSDPHIPHTIPVRRHDPRLEHVELTAENVGAFDALLIATDHSDFDYELVAEKAHLILDTRNAIGARGLTPKGRLVKA